MWNGGLASTWSKAESAQRRGRAAQVALVDGERQAVFGGVAARELGVGGLDLEAVQVEPRHARGEAERGGAGAAAELEHALAGRAGTKAASSTGSVAAR